MNYTGYLVSDYWGRIKKSFPASPKPAHSKDIYLYSGLRGVAGMHFREGWSKIYKNCTFPGHFGGGTGTKIGKLLAKGFVEKKGQLSQLRREAEKSSLQVS